MRPDPNQLKQIPAVDGLLQEPDVAALQQALAREAVVALIRETLQEVRRAYLAGELETAALGRAALVARITRAAAELVRPPLRRVLNATGILIHTNLGRAPLAVGTQAAMARVAGGYCNLEMDLESGERHSRLADVRALLQRVTGAPDGLAVNNNAGAVFLVLSALSAGREVIVARGELVEIGGSFRLPDIMAASGARLREVGTTNRTRLADYAAALGPETAMILKVHPSNFVIAGFTEEPALDELVALAREHQVPLVYDLGSGALAQHPDDYLHGEPRVQAALAAGVDLVTFSGDKLLGGPQAGIILGDTAWVAPLQRHPIARVVRLDKLHLAGLEATLQEYLRGAAGVARIPLYRLLSRPVEELRAVAEAICARLTDTEPGGLEATVVETRAAAGGGALPGEELPSAGVAVRPASGSVARFARWLRVGEPAIVGRIEQDRLILDLRALNEEDGRELPELLRARHAAFLAHTQGESSDGA